MYQRTITALIAYGFPWPSLRPYVVPGEVLEEIRGVVTDLRSSELDISWLENALADTERRWFAAKVLAEASGSDRHIYDLDSDPDAPADTQRLRIVGEAFPDAILDALIRAAVLEPDPSFDGIFVMPAVWIFGWQRTMEALLNYVRNGSDAEKWGAVNALYHAGGAWRPPCGPVQIDAPTRERLGSLVHEEMLRQFVQANDLALQQTIVRWLRPVDAYPPGLRDLARRAHEIARNHPDEFVRTSGTSVGEQGKRLFSPLPTRESGNS